MEDRYQNKYRVSSPRLSRWDYGSHGLYFVTICTKDRVHNFGEIENNFLKCKVQRRKVQRREVSRLYK